MRRACLSFTTAARCAFGGCKKTVANDPDGAGTTRAGRRRRSAPCARLPPAGLRNADHLHRCRKRHPRQGRLERTGLSRQRHRSVPCRLHALQNAARRAARSRVVCSRRDTGLAHRAFDCVRSGRIFHDHVLRFLFAAHDRRAAGALPGRGARRFHQLFDRSQSRRHRVHRRRDPVSNLFGMGTVADRHRQNRIHHRTHLLARQRLRAWPRHGDRARSRERARPVSALGQPGHRTGGTGGDLRLPALAFDRR